MVFQFGLQGIQFFVDFRHSFFHRGIFGYAFFFRNTCTFCPTLRTDFCDLLRGTDTGHNIFTLCVDQIFAIKQILTVTCVTREANTGSRSITHVTEYHGLYAYSSTPFGRNTFHFAVKNGAFVHPAAEYSTNGTPKLFVCTGRKILSGLFFYSNFKAFNQFFKVFHFQFVVELHTFFFLYFFDNFLERIDVFLVHRFHTQYHVTIHLYETTVRIPCETGASGLAAQAFHHFVI